jgi:hypothetical protein
MASKASAGISGFAFLQGRRALGGGEVLSPGEVVELERTIQHNYHTAPLRRQLSSLADVV